MFEFRLPDIGEGVAEGEVVQWFVKEGETIKEDAPLLSVLTDKANVEIPSPRAGRIAKLHAAVGQKVKVGGLLVTIDDGSASGAASPGPEKPRESAPPPAAKPAAPANTSGASASAAAPGGSRVLATPYLRRLAAERGIDLETVRGTGPQGRITEADLVAPTRSSAASAAAAPPAPAMAPEPTSPAQPESKVPSPPPPPAPTDEETERVPIRGIRGVIAEHMDRSVHTAAHFTYVEEVDAGELVRVRDRMAKHVEKGGAKLTYLPFIIKAVVAGLRAYPWMNAKMDDARHELVVYKNYHIGIATAAPEGLIVPVISHAERKSVNRLAQEIQDLSERGRQGKLSRAELTGSTFTITSLGALGGLLATPILNYPEVSILGVHKIQKRPTYLPDGTIGPGLFLNLSVSLDHRVLDGVVGAQFLAVVKAHLEDPHLMFADLS